MAVRYNIEITRPKSIVIPVDSDTIFISQKEAVLEYEEYLYHPVKGYVGDVIGKNQATHYCV